MLLLINLMQHQPNKSMRNYLYFLVLLLSTGCIQKRLKVDVVETKKYQGCSVNWVYKDLPEKLQNVRVLLFHPKEYISIHAYSSFLIGITASNDTIALLDKDFTGSINVGSRVELTPYYWTLDEKEIFKPLVTIYTNKESWKNDFYCSVKPPGFDTL